jgi:hypothetical protein
VLTVRESRFRVQDLVPSFLYDKVEGLGLGV